MSNHFYTIFCILAIVSLILYAHCDIIVFGGDNAPMLSTFALNFIGVCIDCLVWDMLIIALAKSRFKFLSHVVFAAVFVYCICHVYYMRAFHTYFDITLITDTQNLNGLGESILSLFRFRDVFVGLIVIILYILGFRASRHASIPNKAFIVIVSLPLLLCMPVTMRCLTWGGTSFADSVITRVTEYDIDRHNYAFKYGLTDLAVRDILSAETTRDLTKEEVAELDRFHRLKYEQGVSIPRNIFLILVESLNTDAIFRICGNDTVMPNLKNIIESDSIIFCPNMVSTVHYGQSSDGQFIYFTGLLPHSQKITVKHFSHNVWPGLGSVMKRNGYKTKMLVPTVTTYWRQDIMCQRYGVDSLYTSLTDEGNLNFVQDEKTIRMAERLIMNSKDDPQFFTLLTASMHIPYEKGKFSETITSLSSPDLADEYIGYLEKANYTDCWLGHFFDFLKAEGLWDSSMIIITSDHKAPLDYKQDKVSEYIPLIIINSGLEKRIVKDEIYQQDLYPTLLDLLSTAHSDYPAWYGVGYSIFSDSAEMRMPLEEQQRMSDIILETDWFTHQ